MDPLALAQLPLATLALAAIFWVAIQLFRFASERLDAERLRTARHNRLLYHAGHNRGVVLATLSSIVTQLDQIAEMARTHEEEKSEEPPKPPSEEIPGAPEGFAAFTNWLERGFAAKKAVSPPAARPADPRMPAGLAAKIVAGFGDYATTPERLDLDDVAKNLDTFDADIAGLVLSFIEEIPMVYALIDHANKQNDKAETTLDYIGTLISLQFACLSAAITSRAIVDAGFRRALRGALTADGPGKTDPVETARALYGLARDHLAWVGPLWYWGPNDGPLLVHLAPGAEIVPGAPVPAYPITTDSAVFFRSEGLKVMNVRRREVSMGDYYIWPAGLILLLGLMLLVAPVRDTLFPPDPPGALSCTTKITSAGAAETQCAHTAPDLGAGLTAGREAAAALPVVEAPQADPEAAADEDPGDPGTATGEDGSVAPLVAPEEEAETGQ